MKTHLLFCSALALSACATTVDPRGIANPAVVSVYDVDPESDAVHLIVVSIDGQRPPGAGPAPRADGTSGSFAGEFEAGTLLGKPAPRPNRWSFAVEPGVRRIGLMFAIGEDGFVNYLFNTGLRGSDATGVQLNLQPGCEYVLYAQLTTIGGRDYVPRAITVRPIPQNYGLPAAVSCPNARDVDVALIRD